MTRRHRSRPLQALLVAAAVFGAGLLAGCGGDSASSKPAYCSDVKALKKSVKDFSVSDGISGVRTQLKQIQTEAKSAAASAKSDFPTQTSDLNSSVSDLTTAVKQIPSGASAADLAALVPMAASVKDAVTGFTGAVSSKC
jgi:outer membrane murein-binding lipoprotein Lpp